QVLQKMETNHRVEAVVLEALELVHIPLEEGHAGGHLFFAGGVDIDPGQAEVFPDSLEVAGIVTRAAAGIEDGGFGRQGAEVFVDKGFVHAAVEDSKKKRPCPTPD